MSDAIQIQVRPRPEALPELRARGAWDRREWRTVAHAPATHIERTRNQLQALAPDQLYEYRAIRKNPPAHLHIPATVAQLGHVLDLTTQSDATRTTWEAGDVGGLIMATDADAMDRKPGTAALYLLRGSTRKASLMPNQAPIIEDAQQTYEQWHERDPRHVVTLDDLPDLIGIYIGRALRIGYRSDKWHERGTTEDYDHDYTEPGYEPPEVWADHVHLGQARAIVIVGGNQRITADGID